MSPARDGRESVTVYVLSIPLNALPVRSQRVLIGGASRFSQFRFRLPHSALNEQPARSTFPRADRDRLLCPAAGARQRHAMQVRQGGGNRDDSLIDPREDQEREGSTARNDGRRPAQATEHFLLPRTCDSRQIHASTRGDAGPDRPPQKPPLGRPPGTPGHRVRHFGLMWRTRPAVATQFPPSVSITPSCSQFSE
jgi:hypothetical protein